MRTPSVCRTTQAYGTRTHRIALGVECPIWEVDGDAACACKREREDEHEDLGTAVDGSTEQVLQSRKSAYKAVVSKKGAYVVLPEPACVVLPDVEVRREADDHPGVDEAVCATSEIPNVNCRLCRKQQRDRGRSKQYAQERTAVLTRVSQCHRYFL